eukprot:TRINITY_DN3296_c0_g2_i1.p1 TRINITY_DN3296_c0_g2~~TRINITY_DN3296_c0_g2_i1.p1  ORF type:complete len:1402 (-),score=284.90 TRINITY_DN3296_c0_g2_i1:498-4703(-)
MNLKMDLDLRPHVEGSGQPAGSQEGHEELSLKPSTSEPPAQLQGKKKRRRLLIPHLDNDEDDDLGLVGNFPKDLASEIVKDGVESLLGSVSSQSPRESGVEKSSENEDAKAAEGNVYEPGVSSCPSENFFSSKEELSPSKTCVSEAAVDSAADVKELRRSETELAPRDATHMSRNCLAERVALDNGLLPNSVVQAKSQSDSSLVFENSSRPKREEEMAEVGRATGQVFSDDVVRGTCIEKGNEDAGKGIDRTETAISFERDDKKLAARSEKSGGNSLASCKNDSHIEGKHGKADECHDDRRIKTANFMKEDSSQPKELGLSERKTGDTTVAKDCVSRNKSNCSSLDQKKADSVSQETEDHDMAFERERKKRRRLIHGPKRDNNASLENCSTQSKVGIKEPKIEKKALELKDSKSKDTRFVRENDFCDEDDSLNAYLRSEFPRRVAGIFKGNKKNEKNILKTPKLHNAASVLASNKHNSRMVNGDRVAISKHVRLSRSETGDHLKRSSRILVQERKKSRVASSSSEGEGSPYTPIQSAEKGLAKRSFVQSRIEGLRKGNSVKSEKEVPRGRSEGLKGDGFASRNASTPTGFSKKGMERHTKKDNFPSPSSAPSSQMAAKFSSSSKNTKGSSRVDKSKKRMFVREEAKKILLGSGWTIDYRPRKGRNYEDSVYISPTGTAIWSLPKAWETWKRSLEEERKDEEGISGASKANEASTVGLASSASLDLSLLKRKRRKKEDIENESGDETKLKKRIKKKKKKRMMYAKESDSDVTPDEEIKEDKKRKSNSSDGFIEKSKRLEKSRISSIQRSKSSHADGNKIDLKKVQKAADLEGQKSQNKTEHRDAKKHGSKGPYGDSVRKHRPQGMGASQVVKNSSQGKKNKNRRSGYGLFVRSSGKGETSANGEAVKPIAKRTVLSWLLDSGVVSEDEHVQYWNKQGTVVMLDGWVLREGIYCECCNSVVSATEFAFHAGNTHMNQPFQNVYLLSGKSWTQCLMEAWDKEDESKKSGRHIVEVDENDQNDDTCILCGDGGDLICCDKCPSTFHTDCLGLENIPDGDWYCLTCSCRICGKIGTVEEKPNADALFCEQCEHHYHRQCLDGSSIETGSSTSSSPSFCGKACQGIYEELQNLIGIKNDLEGGFSWTVIKHFDEDQLASYSEQSTLGKMAECNAKLCVAYRVMDECFVPIIDPRTNIDMVSNVVYSCWSNFPRLNYKGFYTIVLEKDDEFLSVASIRIHGTHLAEMPLIGTRHHFRRKGMCRRLVNAIEGMLRRFNVEKLMLPAIPELLRTWTSAFGFKPLTDEHKKEIRSMNLMVFPGTDLLQKEICSASTEKCADDGKDSVTKTCSNGNHTTSEIENGGKVKIDSCEVALPSSSNKDLKCNGTLEDCTPVATTQSCDDATEDHQL